MAKIIKLSTVMKTMHQTAALPTTVKTRKARKIVAFVRNDLGHVVVKTSHSALKKQVDTIKPSRNVPNRDREIFEVLRLIKDYSATEVSKATAKRAIDINDKAAYVSPTTITKWRMDLKRGGTKYPMNRTIDAVYRAYGKKRETTDSE